MIDHDTVWAMWMCYEGGLSLTQVAKHYKVHRSDLAHIFKLRGMQTRPHTHNPHDAKGRWVPMPPKTEAEIAKIIAGMKWVHVPQALRHEWRSWSMERRRAFIHQARAKIGSRFPIPTSPFSSNVRYFEYGMPEAMAIAKEENRDKDSHSFRSKLKPCSQGVIWNGRFWFWTHKEGMGYEAGPWKPDTGRPMLHWAVWEQANGRPVPPHHQVIFLDGNKNNFDPKNLGLRSKAECCWENRKSHYERTGRAATALLLQSSQQKESDANHDLTRACASQRG